MKVLRPTLREKRRWILVIFEGERPENPGKFVVSAIRRYLGVLGMALAHPRVEEKDGKVLISVNREYVDAVRAAIVLGRGEFLLRTVVAGTVEGLRRKGFL